MARLRRILLKVYKIFQKVAMIIDLMRAKVVMPQLRHRAPELCGGSHILARYEQTFAQYLKRKPDDSDEVMKNAPAQGTCDHCDSVTGATFIKRYGNPSGSYARCRQCRFRWKWNEQANPPCWAAYLDAQDASRASTMHAALKLLHARLWQTARPAPTLLRIGSPKHMYVFQRLNDDTYLCKRGSDWAADGERLVLKRCHERWTAYDCAPADIDKVTEEEGPPHGIAVYDTGEDVTVEGWHVYRTNYTRSPDEQHWRATGSCWMTTILR